MKITEFYIIIDERINLYNLFELNPKVVILLTSVNDIVFSIWYFCNYNKFYCNYKTCLVYAQGKVCMKKS